jgi:hypothetical protein
MITRIISKKKLEPVVINEKIKTEVIKIYKNGLILIHKKTKEILLINK